MEEYCLVLGAGLPTLCMALLEHVPNVLTPVIMECSATVLFDIATVATAVEMVSRVVEGGGSRLLTQ